MRPQGAGRTAREEATDSCSLCAWSGIPAGGSHWCGSCGPISGSLSTPVSEEEREVAENNGKERGLRGQGVKCLNPNSAIYCC